MHKLITILAMAALNFMLPPASASVNISIEVVQYPVLQRVPGYPVYYAPRLHANYFFYDGLYWVYVDDEWYASPWFDGPWDLVAIDNVPLFILRVPVRYYRYPPVIFRSWAIDTAPRWDRVWGPDWASRHANWQRWNRAAAPAPAPLPSYQQRFTRTNYPDDAQRRNLAQQHYRYKPHDPQVRQGWQGHVGESRNRPHARPNPPHQDRDRVQMVAPAESPGNTMHPNRREPAPESRPPPPRDAPTAWQERAPVRSEPNRNEPAPVQRHSDTREFAHSAEPRHGGRPDKPDKPDKDEGHKSDKHH
ncbi:hypothetical protein [Duganella sp. Root1480D1]|uniref:hypothetical protein n=1 Tax=Duganella sp. Root1480D1 TaxID=1736471 RepID=UPI000AF83D87|nr:hypothetical protein [Duganella sp. Root1480D1]